MDQTGPSHYQRTTLVDFRLILNIAHGNFTGVSRAISFGEELYNLLILCDKYDLTALIGPWVRMWLLLFHIQHVMPVPMLPFIVWAVGDYNLFITICWHIVENSKVDKDTGGLSYKGQLLCNYRLGSFDMEVWYIHEPIDTG